MTSISQSRKTSQEAIKNIKIDTEWNNLNDIKEKYLNHDLPK